jgi:hypothetical protein
MSVRFDRRISDEFMQVPTTQLTVDAMNGCAGATRKRKDERNEWSRSIKRVTTKQRATVRADDGEYRERKGKAKQEKEEPCVVEQRAV